MIGQTDTASLASNISAQLHQAGVDVAPATVKSTLDTAQWVVDGTYRFVTEQAIPSATYLVGQLYSMYMGDTEVPQTAIDDRKIEAAVIQPQLIIAAKAEQKVEPEDKYQDAEWGELDSDFHDAVESFDTPKTEKPVEEAVVSAKKSKSVVAQKKTAKKKGPQIGFGSHVPPSFSRKDETDAEFINKLRSKIRSYEDPSKPKTVRKARSFSRLEELAKAKPRSENKHLSNYDVEMKFRNSLRT